MGAVPPREKSAHNSLASASPGAAHLLGMIFSGLPVGSETLCPRPPSPPQLASWSGLTHHTAQQPLSCRSPDPLGVSLPHRGCSCATFRACEGLASLGLCSVFWLSTPDKFFSPPWLFLSHHNPGCSGIECEVQNFICYVHCCICGTWMVLGT